MKSHELKTWPEPFEAVRDGRKRHEFRKDDRGYEIGDELVLREWDPETQEYTGERALCVEVTYLTRGPAFGIPEGYVVMSIARGSTLIGEEDAEADGRNVL